MLTTSDSSPTHPPPYRGSSSLLHEHQHGVSHTIYPRAHTTSRSPPVPKHQHCTPAPSTFRIEFGETLCPLPNTTVPVSSPDVEIPLDIPLSISSPSALPCRVFLECGSPCLGFHVRHVLPYKSELLDSLVLCVLHFLALSLSLFLYTVPEIVP
jgi:hypothetical protein